MKRKNGKKCKIRSEEPIVHTFGVTLLLFFLIITSVFAQSCAFNVLGDENERPVFSAGGDNATSSRSESSLFGDGNNVLPATEVTVLCDVGLCSALTADDDSNVASATANRNERLSRIYGLKIETRECADIYNEVKNLRAAGKTGYDLLLLRSQDAAAKLLCDALLDDMSGELKEENDRGTIGTLTDISVLNTDISFGGGVYYAFCDAFASVYSSAGALAYYPDGRQTGGDDMAQVALAGNLTVETVLRVKEKYALGIEISGGKATRLAMLNGVGGNIFKKDGDDLPFANIKNADFATAYTAALSLVSAASDGEAQTLFSFCDLSYDIGDGVFLPMPKLSREQDEYVSAADVSRCPVFAVPRGSQTIKLAVRVIGTLAAESEGIGEAFVNSRIGAGAFVSETEQRSLVQTIVDSRRFEGASLYTAWGLLDELIDDGLSRGFSIGDVLAEGKWVDDRIALVSDMASIVKNDLKHWQGAE